MICVGHDYCQQLSGMLDYLGRGKDEKGGSGWVANVQVVSRRNVERMIDKVDTSQ
jgi:hypothetical protein